MITIANVQPAQDEHQSLRVEGVSFSYQRTITLRDPQGVAQLLNSSDMHHEEEGVVFLQAVLAVAGTWQIDVHADDGSVQESATFEVPAA